MTDKTVIDKRCRIEVEGKPGEVVRILVVATTEKKALKLFKDVRKEIDMK